MLIVTFLRRDCDLIMHSSHLVGNCGRRLPSIGRRLHIVHEGLFIESMDAEESTFFNGCMAATANIPCPCCLAHSSQLDKLTMSFPPRTSSQMRKVYEDAQRMPSGKRDEYLATWGLKDVENFLWDIPNSDPYLARSYDLLHFDDLGKWGKHLWVLLKQVMKDAGHADAMDNHLRHFPRWRGLKHIDHASQTEYADGNWFRDLLKCILPCIVQHLPRNDPLIHCIRAYIKYRMMVGLQCLTETRLATTQQFIANYERRCEAVTKKYGKKFNFLKQHLTAHVVDDIRQTGSLSNKTTRINEAYQQEARAQYETTNFKNAEQQMSQKDADMETIAFIRWPSTTRSTLPSILMGTLTMLRTQWTALRLGSWQLGWVTGWTHTVSTTCIGITC